MQVALLRVLQERTITPIGSSKLVPVNIRIITATHKDLLRLVEEGKFRQDLYYRLHVYPLYVPSLIERKEDIPYFIQHFCERKNWNVVFPKSIYNQFYNIHGPKYSGTSKCIRTHLHFVARTGNMRKQVDFCYKQ